MLSVFLVVDDEEADQIIAAHVIRQYNPSAVIHQVYDGREALEWLEGSDVPPDVIFLDINMPRMSGLQFLSAYEADSSRAARVVMLTSSSQERDRAQTQRRACVIDYFDKPLTLANCTELDARLARP